MKKWSLILGLVVSGAILVNLPGQKPLAMQPVPKKNRGDKGPLTAASGNTTHITMGPGDTSEPVVISDGSIRMQTPNGSTAFYRGYSPSSVWFTVPTSVGVNGIGTSIKQVGGNVTAVTAEIEGWNAGTKNWDFKGTIQIDRTATPGAIVTNPALTQGVEVGSTMFEHYENTSAQSSILKTHEYFYQANPGQRLRLGKVTLAFSSGAPKQLALGTGCSAIVLASTTDEFDKRYTPLIPNPCAGKRALVSSRAALTKFTIEGVDTFDISNFLQNGPARGVDTKGPSKVSKQ